MSSTVYELDPHGNFPRKAIYTLPPKDALVCFIMQYIHKNFNTWEYPEIIEGMRKSKHGWFYDYGNNVIAAYQN